MKRILWITDNEFDTQTWTTRLVEVISSLQKSYDIQLVTSYSRRKIQPEVFNRDIAYYSTAKRRGAKAVTRFIEQCRIFRKTVETFRPDIVLINAWNPVLVRRAVSARQKSNMRVIFDTRTLPVSHSKVRNGFWGAMLASCLRNTAKDLDGITYITETMRRYCIEKYQLPPHANAVWSSGVNPEVFRPSSVTGDSDHFGILYHGCIARQRRIDNVIKALSLLKDMDIHFFLLGDGDCVADLKQLARTTGMEDRVSFHGPVANDQVPAWINRCDAGILPFQDWQGWNVSSPIKLFEYLACGKPVIVTDIPAHRGVLKDAEFAFWAEQSTPEQIAKAIRQAHEKRKDFRRLASEARELVLREYTWERQAEELKRFCDSLLQSNEPVPLDTKRLGTRSQRQAPGHRSEYRSPLHAQSIVGTTTGNIVRSVVREIFGFVLRFSGIAWAIISVFCKNKVAILVYHRPNPRTFRAHMEYLSKRHEIIPLDTLLRAIEGGRPSDIPPGALVVTVDDGHKSNYELLATIREFNIRPTVYVCSDIVRTNRHFWWFHISDSSARSIKKLPADHALDTLWQESRYGRTTEYLDRQALSETELTEMEPHIDFGSHTRFHLILPRCTDKECMEEIRDSKGTLDACVSRPVEHFAYPNGDYGQREIEYLRTCGYRSGRTLDVGWNSVKTDPYRLKAVGIEDDASINVLCGQLTGIFPYLKYLWHGSFRGIRPRSL